MECMLGHSAIPQLALAPIILDGKQKHDEARWVCKAEHTALVEVMGNPPLEQR